VAGVCPEAVPTRAVTRGRTYSSVIVLVMFCLPYSCDFVSEALSLPTDFNRWNVTNPLRKPNTTLAIVIGRSKA
jgi:hypothetical protein